MGKAGKQAARNAAKKAAARNDSEDEAPQSGQAGGKFVELAKKLVMESMMAEVVPKLRPLLTETPSTEETKAEPAGDKDATEDDAQPKDIDDKAVVAEDGSGMDIFNSLRSRLVWHNSLGLAKSPAESWKSWLSMKSLELDWGPRPKKKGNPGLDRVSANLYNHMPQYAHILLVLMMLRSFLFRSYFACLPWLVGYQALSLLLPTEPLPQVPQVPLDQVPTKYRVAATACLHALVLLFFFYELVWRTWFFEKFLVLGLVAGHAYVVRPAEP